MPEWLTPFIAAVGTIALGVLTWASTRTGTMGRRLAALEKRVGALERVAAVRMDYIEQLRQHIDEGKGPPPPPYPRGVFLHEREG
jgi:hypothetical protein